jgi:uncharacterized membrane protein
MELEKKNMSREYRIIKLIPVMLVGFLVILNLLPFLAPLLAHYGQDKISSAIYFIYSFACHQKAHRSLHIYDHQCAWCVRDTFIWGALLAVAVLVFTSRKKISGLSWKSALILGLPMALDGTIQLIATISSLYTKTTPFYESTNSLRALTGTFFGTAVGMYLFPRLKTEIDAVKEEMH